MAAMTDNGAIRYISPVGYEDVMRGKVTETVKAGTPLVQGASGWSKAPAGALDFHGVAVKDYYAGQTGCDIAKICELDGFTGLTPGASANISASVAGGWDTTVPTNGVVRARAISTTRIRVMCV